MSSREQIAYEGENEIFIKGNLDDSSNGYDKGKINVPCARIIAFVTVTASHGDH